MYNDIIRMNKYRNLYLLCGESNEILYVIKILDFNIGFNFFILSVLSKIDSFIFDF